jgi:hypothetical protein
MEILWLDIADPPDVWQRLGFTVDERPDGGASCVVNGVELRFHGSDGGAEGVTGWGVRGVDPTLTSIDGIATTVANDAEPAPSSSHANGVFRIDHLVVHTPSTPRTAAAMESVGLEIRGRRRTTARGAAVDMRFCWAGDTLLELAGPPTPDEAAEAEDGVAAEPARVAGIAFASNDLDAAVTLLGDRCTPPVDAVQPGRRITAIRSEVGSSVPIALMTPHVKD